MATKPTKTTEPAVQDMSTTKEYKADLGTNGYPATDVKSTGIKMRGAGAATKGVMSRGSMA